MIGANVSAFSIGKAVGRGGGGVPPFNLQYASVAGGGGGGYYMGGGGGAGGYLEGTTEVVVGTAYQVTVGAGGVGGTTTVTKTNVSAHWPKRNKILRGNWKQLFLIKGLSTIRARPCMLPHRI